MAISNKLNFDAGSTQGLTDYIQPTGVQPLPALANLSTSQTVQGQMANLMSSTNPLMQRATTRASQAANKRGLLNTSMGVQAGQEAALSAALPIAQLDAGAYQKQALANQGYLNQFSSENQRTQNQKSLSDQAYAQQTGTGTYSGGGLISSKLSADKELAAQQQAHQTALQTGQFGQQSAESKLGREQQTALQASQLGQQSAESLLGREQQTALQASQFGQQSAEAKLGREQQTELQESQFGQQSEESLLGREQQTALQEGQIEQQTKESVLNRQHELTKQAQAEQNKQVLLKLDEQARGRLLTVEQEYKQLLQESATASSIYSDYMGSIGAVLAQEKIAATEKTSLINSLTTKLNEVIGSVQAIRNKELPTLGDAYSGK
jgi:hypothetical protein